MDWLDTIRQLCCKRLNLPRKPLKRCLSDTQAKNGRVKLCWQSKSRLYLCTGGISSRHLRQQIPAT